MMSLSRGSKVFLVVLLVLGLGAAGSLALVGSLTSGSDGEGEPVAFDVAEGASVSSLAPRLAEAGVIRSATAFRLVARFDDRASQIKPGSYELRTGMSPGEVLEILSVGPPPPETFRVLIREGLTVPQTLEAIASAEGSPFTVEELRAALASVPLPEWVPVGGLPEEAEPFEGLLFPNTYEFLLEVTAEQVLGRLVAQTEQVIGQVAIAEGRTAYEILTMASLIEREARLRAEQPRIASVIENRLEIGMRLEIDATVLYALGEHKDRVLYADLEVESPWNTYRNLGLPPTPISGSGEAAIQAAASPADEDFLFYVVIDPATGEHGFSRTLDEHNRLRNEARQGS